MIRYVVPFAEHVSVTYKECDGARPIVLTCEKCKVSINWSCATPKQRAHVWAIHEHMHGDPMRRKL